MASPKLYPRSEDHFEATAVVVGLCECGCGKVKVHLLDEDDVVAASCSLSRAALDNLNALARGESEEAAAFPDRRN